VVNELVLHVVPEQHPLPQEVESHTQLPLWHRCPAAQAGPPLHVHAPSAEQPSPLEPHAVQVPPATPQVDDEADMHTLFAQHPAGHEAALQTQVEPTQSRPAVHAGPPPHEQAPAVQPSALAPHVEQEPPPVPHAPTDGGVHVDPEQQPPGQVVPLQPAHAPPLQNWFTGHPVHVAPPEPHIPWVLPGSHVAPLQQPAHPDMSSQTQAPPEQRCPVEHAGPLPHVHPPLDEHPSAVAPHD
jgi:hypothetical protein